MWVGDGMEGGNGGRDEEFSDVWDVGVCCGLFISYVAGFEVL
jgi:hypothetical protein